VGEVEGKSRKIDGMSKHIGTVVAGITVPGVCKAMGVEPHPRLMWTVGLVTQNKFRTAYGRQPPKDNRQKTYTEGVHCYAIYPEHFRPIIEAAIKAYGTEAARQGDLFKRGEE
jgi:hypothetical protein